MLLKELYHSTLVLPSKLIFYGNMTYRLSSSLNTKKGEDTTVLHVQAHPDLCDASQISQSWENACFPEVP